MGLFADAIRRALKRRGLRVRQLDEFDEAKAA